MNNNTDVIVNQVRICAARQENDEGRTKLWVAAYISFFMNSEERVTIYEA